MPPSPRKDIEDIPIDTEQILNKNNLPSKTVRPETSKLDKRHNIPLEKLMRATKNSSVFQRKYAKMGINTSKINQRSGREHMLSSKNS